MEQVVKNTPSTASNQQSPVSPSSSSTAEAHLSIESVEKNIKGIIDDADNFMMNSSSLPPQLMGTLESLQDHLQALSEKQRTSHQQDADEIKGKHVWANFCDAFSIWVLTYLH
jgi:hypothetical protein